jgi:hypothetical protein
MKDGECFRAMVSFALSFEEVKDYDPRKPEHFATGLPFALMLADSEAIGLVMEELDRNGLKWINRVSNLKKILAKVRVFFDKRLMKSSKIDDIDVVEIAKHNSQEHLALFFEVVMTVLLASDFKEQYIQRIMTLEEDVQKTFVEIIKKTSQEEDTFRSTNSALVELED